MPLIGALDAVVLEGGRGAVWELKSSKKRYSQDQFEFDLQATAYGIAAREGGYDGVDLKFLITTKSKNPDVQREIEAAVAFAEDSPFPTPEQAAEDVFAA